MKMYYDILRTVLGYSTRLKMFEKRVWKYLVSDNFFLNLGKVFSELTRLKLRLKFSFGLPLSSEITEAVIEFSWKKILFYSC